MKVKSARCASACVDSTSAPRLTMMGILIPWRLSAARKRLRAASDSATYKRRSPARRPSASYSAATAICSSSVLVERADVLALPERVTHFCIFSDSSVLLSFVDCLKVRFTFSSRLRFADGGLLQETSTVPFYMV